MKNDTVILSCSTLRQELELVMEKLDYPYPVVWVDSGLHVWPDRLRSHLQAKLDELSPEYTRVLLLFGFCGNSMVGIKSGARTLVLPSAADCIPIFLGSQETRQELGNDSYFFTAGYLNFEHTMLSEHRSYRKRYSEEKANYITKKMMAHYKHLTVIDTGAFEVQPVVDEVKTLADLLEIPVRVVPGNLCFIEDLLSGNWTDNRFLIVHPGSEITLNDSLCVGKSLIC